MPTELTVFVSCNIHELKAEHSRLCGLIPTLSMGDTTLEIQAYDKTAPDSERPNAKIYLKALEASDLYIGLFGSEYTERTIEEFEHAVACDIPQNIYIKTAEDKPRDLKFEAELENLIMSTSGIIPQTFSTLDDLENKVKLSLYTWMADQRIYQSIPQLQQALKTARDNSDRPAECVILCNMGHAYRSQGQHQEAIDHYQQSLAISDQLGDRHFEEMRLADLGMLVHSSGHYDQAIRYFQQALDISRKIGTGQREGIHLGRLGAAHFSLGQYKEAFEHYSRALDADRKSGNRSRMGSHLIALGLVHYVLGHYQWAIDHHQQGLVIKRELGERHEVGNALYNLGAAYSKLNQHEQAINHFRQALTIARELGDQRNEGEVLANMGTAYANLGQIDQAVDHYQQARASFIEVGVPHLIEWVDKAIAEARPQEPKSGLFNWWRRRAKD